LIEGPPAHNALSLTRWFEPQVGEVPLGTLPAQWLPAPTSA
jgi:hypothetical protein